MQILGNLFYHRRLPVDFLDKYYCSAANPSILYDPTSDLFYINVRNTNYKLKKNRKGAYGCPLMDMKKGKSFETRNFITVCRNPMEDTLQWYLIKEQKRQFYCNKHGFEDARLVKWKNNIYLSATLCDYNTGGMGRIALVKLDNRYNEVDHYLLEGTCNDCTRVEKNYQPIIDKPFTFIVSNDPVVVSRYSIFDLKPTYLKGKSGMCIGTAMLGAYRGSSQVVPYKEGYISIVHHSEKDGKSQHHYFHHVVQYDKDFNIIRISKPYKFEGQPVEFCCGMTIKDDFAYITYSVMDKDASVMRIPVEDLLVL